MSDHPNLCHALHHLAQYLAHFPQEADSQPGDLSHSELLAQVFADQTLGGREETETALLGKIVSEFISEYRAIFETESTLEFATDHDIHGDRNRLDNDEDECPEDMKAM